MVAKKIRSNTQNLLIGLGIFLLILAGFFYFNSKKQGTNKPPSSKEETIIQQEGTVKKIGDMFQPLNDEEIKKMREEIDSVLSISGETTNFKRIVGGTITGEAKRAFSDGKFYFRVKTTGLKTTEKGYYHEVFLEKDSSYFSVGRLEVDTIGNGVLYYSSSINKTDYNKVIVTIEPEDGNPAPATTVLEASF